MSGVGIVCIVLGILWVCGRLPLVVAPGQTLQRFRRLVSSDSRLRVLGAVFIPLGAAMIWVADPAERALDGVVMFLGMWILGASLLLLIALRTAPPAINNTAIVRNGDRPRARRTVEVPGERRHPGPGLGAGGRQEMVPNAVPWSALTKGETCLSSS